MRRRIAVVVAISLVVALLVWFQSSHRVSGKSGSVGTTQHDDAASTAGSATSPPKNGAASSDEDPAMAAAVLEYLGQAGVPARPIGGRVTFDGHPVEGATVTLSSALQRLKLAPATQVVTKADGRFTFGPQPALTFTVAATAKGKAPAVVQVQPADTTAKPPADDLELALGGCEATVFGTIRDNSGGVVGEAKIGQDEGVGTRSAADGGYELCARTGELDFEVSAAGYGGVRLNVSAFGRVQRDVILVPEGTIVGKAILKDTGEPVRYAQVSANPMVGGRQRPAGGLAVTDVDGRFTIGGMTPGRYRLGAGAAGLGFEEQVEVLVEAGHTSPEKTLRLVGRATVKGRVVAAGKPVVGARVSLTRRAPTAYSGAAYSQPDGSFVLRNVPIGESTVLVKPYEVLSPSALLVPAGGLTDAVLEVKPLAAVRGRVLFHGAPVADVQVEAGQGFRTVSRPDGTYELKGFKAGEYELSARSASVGAFVDHMKLTLADGEQRSLDLDLVNEGRITGLVVDQQGKAVAGAWVRFASPKTDDESQCGADIAGVFACTQLRGGEYKAEVYVSADSQVRMQPASGAFPTVPLKDGKTVVGNVRLTVQRDELMISGRVVDGSGSPVPDARVDALATETGQDARFDTWTPYPRALTDQDGQFELRGLVARTYALRAHGGAGAEGIVSNVAAGRRDVVLTVAKAGGIEGSLVGFSGTPAVYVHKVGHLDGFSPATLQGDRFSIDGLAPGKYVVTASTLAEGQAGVVEVQPSKTARLTLTSHGSGRLEGTVTEWGSGRPLAALVCHTVLRADEYPGITNWSSATAPKTDARGHFVLEQAPAGTVSVSCFDKDHSTTVHAVVSQGQTTTVTMQAVKAKPNAVGSIGVDFDWVGPTPRLEVVYPRGPAAAAGLLAGDVVTGLDGVAVAGLNSAGTYVLIAKREIGTSVRVTVQRGSQSITVPVRVASSSDGSDGAP